MLRLQSFSFTLLMILWAALSDGKADLTDTSSVLEYCQYETFKGRCRWNSEVIVMTSAKWGRMKIGRCLEVHPKALAALGNDPMFLGCSEDVLSVADKKCSGRSECDIRIPDSDLDKVMPCYPDQKSYLEASYNCVKVVQETRSCLISVSPDLQFISSMSTSSSDVTTMTSSCGSKSHPWRLEAPAGQRINISLLDFAASGTDRNGLSRDRDVSCQQYGYVVEKSSKKNVSLCAEGGAGLRESAVYTSDTNSVEIVLVIAQNDRTNASKYNFLIRVEAVGCTNVVPPDNAWLKRSNNDIIIGCYSSQQTWQLKCDGRDWKGHIGTCPELYSGTLSPAVAASRHDDTTLVTVVVVAIAGTALIICVLVISVGCICLRRYKNGTEKKLPLPMSMCHVTGDNGPYGRVCVMNNDNNSAARVPLAAGTQPHRQPQDAQTMASAQYFLLDNQQMI